MRGFFHIFRSSQNHKTTADPLVPILGFLPASATSSTATKVCLRRVVKLLFGSGAELADLHERGCGDRDRNSASGSKKIRSSKPCLAYEEPNETHLTFPCIDSNALFPVWL
ncbi:MAG: hypothetical protein ACREV4_07120 [Gammaproteobacteria bacterium]